MDPEARKTRQGFARAGRFKMGAIMMEQGCLCPCCGVDLIEHGDYHLDHIMPLSKGGKNEYWNAQFLCVRTAWNTRAK